MNLIKKGVAEFIGTFVLVFFACGVAGVTHGDLVPTALSFGLALIAMAYSIGRISGCHINPAVSLGCLLTKRMTLVEFFVYVGSQLVGGIVGAIAIFGIFRMGFMDSFSTQVGDACNYFIGYNATTSNTLTVGGTFGALLLETILTSVFVYVILNVTDPKAGSGKKAGVIIGFTLTVCHLIGIKLTGTSVNPARSFATAISSLIYTGSTDALAQIWIFIVAPLLGGVLAALLFKVLHKEKENKEETKDVEATK